MASKQELTGQVKIVDGGAVLPTSMCYTLTAGYDLYNFHPRAKLEELEGSYCLNTIFLKNTELVYTLDEHRKPKLQSFAKFKSSIKESYQYDMNFNQDHRDRILVWSDGFKVDYLDSKLPIKALANHQVHEAHHLITEILGQEEKILTMISQLERFMMTAQTNDPRTKRNLLNLLLGPDLGLCVSITYI